MNKPTNGRGSRANWLNHIDLWKFIVNFDNRTFAERNEMASGLGDEAQRIGMFWLAYVVIIKNKLRGLITNVPADRILEASEALDFLEVPGAPGNYRRHPELNKWVSRPDVLTRDQATGICALFLAGTDIEKHRYFGFEPFRKRKRRLFHFMWNMFWRAGFTNNLTKKGVERGDVRDGESFPDWFGFSQWAICLRALGGRWFYPLYLILDLELIFSAVQYRKFDGRSDVLNHVVRCVAAGSFYPTPWAWLANRINDPGDLHSRLTRYFTRVDGPDKQIGPPMEFLYSTEFLKAVMR